MHGFVEDTFKLALSQCIIDWEFQTNKINYISADLLINNPVVFKAVILQLGHGLKVFSD